MSLQKRRKIHVHRFKQSPFSSKLDNHFPTIRHSPFTNAFPDWKRSLSPSRREKKDRQEITRKFKGEISRIHNKTPFSHLQVSRRQGFNRGAKKKEERERMGVKFSQASKTSRRKEISCARYDQTEYLGPVKWPAYTLIGIKLSRVAFSNSPRRR